MDKANKITGTLKKPILSSPKMTISNMTKSKLPDVRNLPSYPPVISTRTSTLPSASSAYASPYMKKIVQEAPKFSSFTGGQSSSPPYLSRQRNNEETKSKPSTSHALRYGATESSKIGNKISIAKDNPPTALASQSSKKTNEAKIVPSTSMKPVTSHKKPGISYIFHHNSRVTDCHTVQVLKQAFQKFNVDSEVMNNPSVSRIRDKIDEISVKDFTHNSCIIFSLLSYGRNDIKFIGSDSEHDIYGTILFRIAKNPTLNGKPKIFLMETCSGVKCPFSVHTDNNTQAGDSVPDYFIIFSSTFRSFDSYLDKDGHSIFIRAFCDAFNQHAEQKDIKDIMEVVKEKVKTLTGKRQIPTVLKGSMGAYIFGDHV